MLSMSNRYAPGGARLKPIHRRNAPWNLARVSSRYKLGNQNPNDLNYEYDYAPEPGKDVDIYVVDTGSFPTPCAPPAKESHLPCQAFTLTMYEDPLG
jgi:hypothetical protein